MFRYSSYFVAALIVIGTLVMLLPTSSATAAIYAGDTITVHGMGSTAVAAEQDAYDNMAEAIVSLILESRPGETIVDIVIEDEHHILPTLYVIEFHVLYDDGSAEGGNPGSG